MKRDPVTIILVAALFIGVLVEAFRHIAPDDPLLRTGQPEYHLAWSTTETGSTPHAVTSGHFALHGSPTPKPVTTVAQATPPVAPAAAKPADDKKKKKKKVAENDKKTTPAKPPEQPKTDSDNKTAGLGGGGGGFYAAPAQTPPQANPDEPKTLKDWETYLLTNPDYQRTMKFVEAYLGGQVSADIFYPVVNEMLADGREPMRSLGVIALSSTPSVNSLLALEQHYNGEPSGTDAKHLMDSALNEYSSPRYLPVLAQLAVYTQDPNSQIFALQRILSIAQSQHSAQQAIHPRLIRGNAQTDTTVASLDRLEPMLQSLVSQYSHTQVGQQALAALNAIKRI